MRIAGILQPGTVLNYVLEAKHVKAGLIVVQTIEERDRVLDENRNSLVNGTPIYVAETHKTYRYNEEQNTFIPEQISYNELANKPTIPAPAAGKLLDAAGTEIFNANQSTNDTVVCIDCGSATELVD